MGNFRKLVCTLDIPKVVLLQWGRMGKRTSHNGLLGELVTHIGHTVAVFDADGLGVASAMPDLHGLDQFGDRLVGESGVLAFSSLVVEVGVTMVMRVFGCFHTGS